MHSTKWGTIWTRSVMTGGLILLGMALAGAATAGDRGHRRHDDGRHASRGDIRDAREYDRRLDHRGNLIDHQLDFFAFVAAASGEYALAHELDRTGDRIERRLDRRGNRAVKQARRDYRQDRRHHRKRYDRRDWDRRDRRDWDRRDRRAHKRRGHYEARHDLYSLRDGFHGGFRDRDRRHRHDARCGHSHGKHRGHKKHGRHHKKHHRH